jgi:hypothetical protein
METLCDAILFCFYNLDLIACIMQCLSCGHTYSQKPQEALNLTVTEEHYCVLFYMLLYTFLHNFLNVLVQIANEMGLQKKMCLCDSKMSCFVCIIYHIY